MYLTEAINYYINVLKSDSNINNSFIIRAFPYTYAPTSVSKAIIAVSPGGIDAKNVGIGSSIYYGKFSIRIDLYLPARNGSPCTSTIIGDIINALNDINHHSVKVSEIRPNDSLECYTAHCIFTHEGEIEYGGD